MSSTKAKRKHRNRAQRYTSNVFAMFSQEQIQEFKEAFNVIDQNRDGFVDKDDLLEMLTSLGKNPTDEFLDKMISEAPGPLNFTMFLTLFGEKLNGTDPEDVIRNAFACFDPDNYGNNDFEMTIKDAFYIKDDKPVLNTGLLPEDYLKELMTTMGDRWTEEQVEELFLGVPIKNGYFDYVQFTRALKHGSDRDEDHKDCPNLPPVPSLGPPGSPTRPTLAQERPRERKISETDKPMVESPRSRRKSLTKPPEKSLEDEFIMRKFSLAASCTTYTKEENPGPPRKISAPALPKSGQVLQPRKLSQTNPPKEVDLDDPMAVKTGLQALQKNLKPTPKDVKPIAKDIKLIQKDLRPVQKEPLKQADKDLKPVQKELPKPVAKDGKALAKDLKPALKPAPKSAMKKS